VLFSVALRASVVNLFFAALEEVGFKVPQMPFTAIISNIMPWPSACGIMVTEVAT
jgi:hypothetical protein